jgi:hypothetical protein
VSISRARYGALDSRVKTRTFSGSLMFAHPNLSIRDRRTRVRRCGPSDRRTTAADPPRDMLYAWRT